jgi:hypothetical protein
MEAKDGEVLRHVETVGTIPSALREWMTGGAGGAVRTGRRGSGE